MKLNPTWIIIGALLAVGFIGMFLGVLRGMDSRQSPGLSRGNASADPTAIASKLKGLTSEILAARTNLDAFMGSIKADLATKSELKGHHEKVDRETGNLNGMLPVMEARKKDLDEQVKEAKVTTPPEVQLALERSSKAAEIRVSLEQGLKSQEEALSLALGQLQRTMESIRIAGFEKPLVDSANWERQARRARESLDSGIETLNKKYEAEEAESKRRAKATLSKYVTILENNATSISEAIRELSGKMETLRKVQPGDSFVIPVASGVPPIEMVWISHKGAYRDNGYWISKYEVTEAQFGKGSGSLPVSNVTWTDAQNFCLGLRGKVDRELPPGKYRPSLPRVDEWLYFAKSAPGGYSRVKGATRPRAVGKSSDEHRGLYDLMGNVQEWLLENYDPSHNRCPEGKELVRTIGLFKKKTGKSTAGQCYQTRWAKSYMKDSCIIRPRPFDAADRSIGFRVAIRPAN